jgi:cyclin G2
VVVDRQYFFTGHQVIPKCSKFGNQYCNFIKMFSHINDTEFFYWRELVSKCLAEYSSPECCKPDLKKLVWIVSRRTAQNLHNSYYSVPDLPTIPEGGCFDESER